MADVSTRSIELQFAEFAQMMASQEPPPLRRRKDGITVKSKTKLALGILTAVAMFLLTFAIPRGGALRDAQLALFPMTVGVWAIFVLLFVKLK